jgi:3-dehydro-4-phosphotetronate decarboxylase
VEETAKLHLLLRGLNPRFLTPAQVADLTKTFGLTLPDHGQHRRKNHSGAMRSK